MVECATCVHGFCVLYLFDTTYMPKLRDPSEELCVGIIEYCRRAPGSGSGRMKLNPLAVSRRALRDDCTSRRRRQPARRPRLRRKLWVNLLCVNMNIYTRRATWNNAWTTTVSLRAPRVFCVVLCVYQLRCLLLDVCGTSGYRKFNWTLAAPAHRLAVVIQRWWCFCWRMDARSCVFVSHELSERVYRKWLKCQLF